MPGRETEDQTRRKKVDSSGMTTTAHGFQHECSRVLFRSVVINILFSLTPIFNVKKTLLVPHKHKYIPFREENTCYLFKFARPIESPYAHFAFS